MQYLSDEVLTAVRRDGINGSCNGLLEVESVHFESLVLRATKRGAGSNCMRQKVVKCTVRDYHGLGNLHCMRIELVILVQESKRLLVYNMMLELT